TIRNILDFPQEFPGTTVVKLEQNYRSTQPILEATNRVIAEAAEGYQKALWTTRNGGQLPALVPCEDENEQSEYVATRILEHREAGLNLRKQAVLFRASHHSILLEAELTRRKIPFVKYGGLKFTEAAHVKDLMAFLRLAENPRDVISGSRILTLLPGIGPKRARQLLDQLASSGGAFHVWAEASVPAATAEQWPAFVRLMQGLAKGGKQTAAVQMQQTRAFYAPLLERQFDNPAARLRDLEQLEQLATRFSDRASLLAEITLDPPTTSEDFAGPPQIDEDYVVLSTIHSAKGLEWDAVYVIHAADGNIPSDMATGSVEEIEEERRLFYVALTRARDWLYVCHPHRYYHVARGPYSDRYGHAPLTRFLPDSVRPTFELRPAVQDAAETETSAPEPHLPRQIRSKLRAMWS
ncbi:MAG TPA: ATP-dependent helicase, partial [Planctomycetaceae bacterium]|nr:ATP-dependent helicase [Planctomycetaceae bacterium]